jgi:lysophospholipase L1-like esterase
MANPATYIDVVPQETYDTFAAAAKRVPVKPGEHWVFLGDSLTDFQRGHNYVDQLAFWLPVTVRNAGVGGDTIVRVWKRLNGEKVYRPDAYHDLYDPKPMRIFIFLGHNDSKLTHDRPFVSPEDFERHYRRVIEKLRRDIGAAIIVISATSSVYEITQTKKGTLFGRPDMLERYNEMARRVAQESGVRYIDVYEPTRTHPAKSTLFTQDGVHLSLEGNHVVALQILQGLARD